MGKIIQYNHWPNYPPVSVDEDLMGQHYKHCLCWRPCQHFKPNPNDGTNCPRAQELFEYCVKWGMVTPVYECPVFKEKT